MEEYTYDEKEKIANKIQKIKKDAQLANIFKIILKHNPNINITTNPAGHFMYFHNLVNDTYYEIDTYLENISTVCKKKKSEKKVIDYSSNGPIVITVPKLKYSNKEINLIKRKKYDDHMSCSIDDSVYNTSE